MGTMVHDAVIIGTGQSGKPLALALARAGWKVAVIEREHVGGTCINTGCTPTKTLVASGRVAYLARRAADYGVGTGKVSIDMPKVRARKQGMVERFRNYGRKAMEKTANLELVFGVAKLAGGMRVTVELNAGGTREFEGRKIIINTGGRPVVPPIPGLDTIAYLDSAGVMELDQVPEHLIVLGGGYIGLEFSQLYRRLGARVTIVNRDARLIQREDPDVSAEVEKILKEDGIEVLNSVEVARIERNGKGARVHLKSDSGDSAVEGSHVLVAVGRAPNSRDLGLEAAGVGVDKFGFITVDSGLRTSAANVYAIGDVKGGPAFTHISYDDFRVLRDNWLHGASANIDGRMVPNCMFIDPQLATVGLNETEAQKRGLKFRVAKLPMANVARALEMSETRGFMKAIVDTDTKQILGCTVLGVEGGEIMSMLQIAMMGKLPYTAIKEGIFAHPTLAESLNNLFMTLD